jgi:hypothetical protein
VKRRETEEVAEAYDNLRFLTFTGKHVPARLMTYVSEARSWHGSGSKLTKASARRIPSKASR